MSLHDNLVLVARWQSWTVSVFNVQESSDFSIDNRDLLEFDSQDWLVFNDCWSLAVYFRSILLAGSILFASTLLPVCFLLPVVYFVIEIASMCWCPIITCLFPTLPLKLKLEVLQCGGTLTWLFLCNFIFLLKLFPSARDQVLILEWATSWKGWSNLSTSKMVCTNPCWGWDFPPKIACW